jgi:protein TonB
VQPQVQGGIIFAPRTIPHDPYIAERPESLPNVDVATMGGDEADAEINPFGNHGQQHPIMREQANGPVRVSGMVVEGMLIQKNPPQYPAIAKATGTQGTVVLQATISRNGTIENLHVVSGPTLLQQAALDAVKNWRYRPYLLSGEPVEVETTVNVIFRMQ